jgi:hypothetical protein
MDRKSKFIAVALGVILLITIGELVNVNTKNEELEKTVLAQAATINEIKNGAEYRISIIRDLFHHKQFSELYNAASELSKYHPGSKEDNEAQGYVIKAKAEEAAVLAKKQEEERKQKELAARSQIEKVRSIIRVSKVYTDDPNSAGGVDLHIVWQNTSNKAVKYCVFSVEPYNAVGDVVECTIKNISEYNGKVTGPISPGQWEGEDNYWECAWYNTTIVKAKLTKINIDYMDGSSEELTGQNLEYVQY